MILERANARPCLLASSKLVVGSAATSQTTKTERCEQNFNAHNSFTHPLTTSTAAVVHTVETEHATVQTQSLRKSQTDNYRRHHSLARAAPKPDKHITSHHITKEKSSWCCYSSEE